MVKVVRETMRLTAVVKQVLAVSAPNAKAKDIKIVESLAVGIALPKLVGLLGKLTVGQLEKTGLELIDFVDDRLDPLELLFVWISEDLG